MKKLKMGVMIIATMQIKASIRVGVIGAGGWGTALADLLARGGHSVTLWSFEPEVARSIELKRENEVYLKGISLSDQIHPTSDIEEAARDKDLIISVSPSHVVREVMERVAPFVDKNAVALSASKGIENETLLTMSQVLRQALGSALPLAVLSGPSFAQEVARGHPTAVSVASEREDIAEGLQHILSTRRFRVYASDDVIGLELGGSLKNVIAIAAGISDGLGFGTNTRAALITRGLAEISRLAVKMGGNPLTLAGLGGMGDLVLTCTGDLSRNRHVGLKLGQGVTLSEILGDMRMVAEGIKTAESAYALAEKQSVEMPITNAVYAILYQGKTPKDAVFELMTRDLKHELDGYGKP